MRVAAAIALLACCACDHAPDPKAAANFVLEPVCKSQIAAHEAALPKAAPVRVAADNEERVRGLVLDRAGAQVRMRALSLEDLVNVGDAAVPVLAKMLTEKDHTDEEIVSILETLGAIDTPSSSDVLAAQTNSEKLRVPWIRAQAAFQLSKQSSNKVLPFLISQLKYETDGETVIWLAAALAKHANFAGLDGLRVLANQVANLQVQADAQSMIQKLADDAKFKDGEELWTAWNGADKEHRVPREEPSALLRREVWHRIANLAEFDLRIVDDARFALSHSAAWVVEPLTQALHDEVPHVRVHVTQCLERMGPRGQSACAELVKALDEPHVASSAAAALASVGCSDAVDALVMRTLAGNGPEMRDAAATALGKLDAQSAIPALRALLSPNEPLDLRQAAAQSLVSLGDDPAAARVLVECLTTPGADGGAAETALEGWLARRAQKGDDAAKQELDQWRKLAGDMSETPTAAQSIERQKKRGSFLVEKWPGETPLPMQR